MSTTFVKKNMGILVLLGVVAVCAVVGLVVMTMSNKGAEKPAETPWNPCKQFLDYEVAQDCYDGTCSEHYTLDPHITGTLIDDEGFVLTPEGVAPNDQVLWAICAAASDQYHEQSDEFWGQ